MSRPRLSRRAPALPTLVLSAWEPELGWLRAWLTGKEGRAAGVGVRLDTVGVGLVDAGIRAARLLADRRPSAVVFMGTAGAYQLPGAPAVDSAVVVDRAVLVSSAALRGDGYLPAPLVTDVAAAPALVRALGDGRPALGAATPLAITRTRALGRRIAAQTQAAVENLELFAVGRAAAVAEVPFAAVVGIANRVGPAAHAEWKAHHALASRAAGERIAAWLRAR